MTNHIRRINTSIRTLFTTFLLVAFTCGIAAAKEEILAKVGSHVLTMKQFQEQIRTLPPQLQMAMMQNPQLREQLLERWVNVTLLGEKAKNLGLDKDPEVAAKIEDIKNSILAQELLKKEIQAKIKVTDEEVEEYYKKNKDKFKEPEQVKARHILIKVDAKADDKKWKEAEKKAKNIKKRIEKGEDFAKLAKEFSDDPGTKNKGGDLGFFTKGRMVPEFEAAAFALKPGQTSDPVKTVYGYHIIQTLEKKSAKQKEFKDVKAQIRQMIQREKERELMEKMLADLKKKHPVTINKELLGQAQGNPHNFR